MNSATASKGADQAPQPTVRSSHGRYIHGDAATVDGVAAEMGSTIVLKRSASDASPEFAACVKFYVGCKWLQTRRRRPMLKA